MPRMDGSPTAAERKDAERREANRRIKPGDTFRMGDHIYGICFDCHQIVKLTGFWKGIHLCLEEAQRTKDVQL